MSLKLISKYWLFLGVVPLLTSCFKEPDFSLTPNINFAKYTNEIKLDKFIGATKDSVVVTIHFQDGDGDLGLSEEDKEAAQASDDFNYLVRSFRKTKGKFTEFEPLTPYSGYFPLLNTETKPGPIEGDLSYTMEFFHSFTPKFDTVKFEIRIKDRAGNLSNPTETDEIVLNRLAN